MKLQLLAITYALTALTVSPSEVLAQELSSAQSVARVAQTWSLYNENIFSSYTNESIQEALDNIWLHGLNPKEYLPNDTSIASREQWVRALDKAIQHISTGVTDPQAIASDIKLKKKSPFTSEQLQVLITASGGSAKNLLQTLAPQSPHYLALQQAMQRLYPLFSKGGWDRISPVNTPLKLNVRNAIIPKLKERLRLYGYQIESNDDLFDNQMLAAINDIQANFKMKPDGIMSPNGKTWTFFYAFCGERVRQIQADMEKLRWLPQRLEDRHIFVNTAFSQFTLIDRGYPQGTVLNFRAINGSAERKTPTLRDRMTYLVFNPTWTVPPTVFIKDKVEAIKNLDNNGILEYFNKNNFQVFNSEFTRTIDPRSIDWKNITSSNVDFYIRQRPNYMNALGVVKFMLTNPYAIYLHDTNQRELFGEAMRQRSSGCVRLERPLDLAEYMLKDSDWNRNKIENFVAKPDQVILEETRVNIKNPIPVYLISITSQLNSDGVIRFVEDTYNHNTNILNQLRGIGK